MTLLIAMEFKHSTIKAALWRENIVRVKPVLLIALLALDLPPLSRTTRS